MYVEVKGQNKSSVYPKPFNIKYWYTVELCSLTLQTLGLIVLILPEVSMSSVVRVMDLLEICFSPEKTTGIQVSHAP